MNFGDVKAEELKAERKQAKDEMQRRCEESRKESLEKDEIVGRSIAFRLLREDKVIKTILEGYRVGASSVSFPTTIENYQKMSFMPKSIIEGVLKEFNEYFADLAILFSWIEWKEERKMEYTTIYRPWWQCMLNSVLGLDTDRQKILETREITYLVIISFKED